MKLMYDASQFDAEIIPIALPDKRLSNVWGDEIYSLSLKAKKMQLSGKYKFRIVKN